MFLPSDDSRENHTLRDCGAFLDRRHSPTFPTLCIPADEVAMKLREFVHIVNLMYLRDSPSTKALYRDLQRNKTDIPVKSNREIATHDAASFPQQTFRSNRRRANPRSCDIPAHAPYDLYDGRVRAQFISAVVRLYANDCSRICIPP